ncbi:UvrD-helicase domain-containing protein [Oceanidesulfovibrio indonesiensis]|nr:UvrD-helicase domain-containing protein [Oceanidesulfovibrio indonesiensis]
MFSILKASAGSGKTYALTAHFLRLLEHSSRAHAPASCGGAAAGYGWSEIVAATFTHAAAQEMKGRVIRSLKERALDLEKSRAGHHPASQFSKQAAAERLAVILRELGLLNIRTIDSLLFTLLRLSALDLGLPPGFEPVFDPAELFEPLYDDIVSRAQAGDAEAQELLAAACRGVLTYDDPGGFMPSTSFRERLLEVFGFRAKESAGFAADTDALQAALASEHAAYVEACGRLADAIWNLGLSCDKRFLNFLESQRNLEYPDEPKDTAFLKKSCLDEVLNKASKGKATPETEAAYAEIAARNEALRANLTASLSCLAYAPLAALAEEIVRSLDEVQRQRGLLLADRGPALVRQLLAETGGIAEAYCRLGLRLRHMLIDEFQDTSRSQWGALAPLVAESLATGGGFLYVGDVKQAIYGWRGGDARLFDEIVHDPQIAPFAGMARLDNLPCNWRSAADVVRFNNEFFTRLGEPDTARRVADAMLPKADEALREFFAAGVAHTFADAAQQVPDANADDRGLVRLYRLPGEKVGDYEDAVKERLHALLFDEFLPFRRPGEVAVLVRKNEQARAIASWCIEWGLPVVTESSLRIAEHPVIRQLASFLAFIDYPLDDLAFWEVATAEWLWESPEQAAHLHSWIAARRPPGSRGEPLHRVFARDFPGIHAAYFQPFLSQAGLMSPYDILREAMDRFGLLEKLPEDELFLRRFLEIAHMADEEGRHSISTFLEYWRSQGLEEKAPLPESMDAVHVTTIHKSKGLEFPVVVVPFHDFSAMSRGGLTTWRPAGPAGASQDDGPGYLVTEQSAAGPERDVRLAGALAEQLHLLYVAWTRPVEELHAFFSLDLRATGNKQLLDGLSVLLEPYELLAPGDVWETGARKPMARREPEPAPESIACSTAPSSPDVEAPYRPMAWLPELKIFRSALEEERFEERRRGTLVHRCLEHLVPANMDGPFEDDVERALRAGLRGLADPHDPAAFAVDRDVVAEEIAAMLRWLLAQPRYPLYLQKGRAEPQIMDETGSVHRPDLLVSLPGELLVIEYKTGQESPDHATQARRYLKLLDRMLPDPKGTTLAAHIVYLDLQRIEEVRHAG